MTHWNASSNRDSAKILDQKNIRGVPRRNKTLMQRVKPGDIILLSAITGAYEVVSEPYEDPFRMKVQPVVVFAEPLELKPLIGDLTFITN